MGMRSDGKITGCGADPAAITVTPAAIEPASPPTSPIRLSASAIARATIALERCRRPYADARSDAGAGALDDSRCADGAAAASVRRNADWIAARAQAVREDVGEIFIIMRRVVAAFEAERGAVCGRD